MRNILINAFAFAGHGGDFFFALSGWIAELAKRCLKTLQAIIGTPAKIANCKLNGFNPIAAICNDPTGDFLTGNGFFKLIKIGFPVRDAILGVFQFNLLNRFSALFTGLCRQPQRSRHCKQGDCKTCDDLTN